MKRAERLNDPEEVLRLALSSIQSRVWTSIPGVIQSWDNIKDTVTVKLGILLDIGGIQEAVKLLVDCPVMRPNGGGYSLTFPIVAGDECLVFIACRCIDEWHQHGGTDNQQAEMRMHDLSDGFVFVGPRSIPRVLSNISTSRVQLRTDDGNNFVEIDEASNLIRLVAVTKVRVEAQDIELVASRDVNISAGRDISLTATARIVENASTSITLSAPVVALAGSLSYSAIGGGSGTMTINGAIVHTGIFTSNSKNIGSTHTHSGGSIGPGTTGVPT